MVSIYGAMTAQRKARIWQLWQRGTPMSVIARDIAKPAATVYSYLLYHGGMMPRQRTRRAGCLSMSERESISCGLSGVSYRAIARIARELGFYAWVEDWRADIRLRWLTQPWIPYK